MSKIVLIDGHSILNRAFYGVPDLTNSSGLHVNGVYGFLNIMFKVIDEEKPDYLCVAFDVSEPTFRHQFFDGYKANRKPALPEFKEQVPVIKDVLKAMGITIVEHAGWEADDILGSLAKKAEADNIEVSLISGDKDLLQIASDKIKICIPKTKGGKTETECYYTKDVIDKYQLPPSGIIELKALMGDTADNYPGVPGVGEKTATALLVQYGTVENVYAHIDEITKKGLHDKLVENRDKAEMSHYLATIKTDCEIDVEWKDVLIGNLYTDKAYELLQSLGLKSILKRFEGNVDLSNDDDVRASFINITDFADCEAVFEKARQCEHRVFFYVHTDADGMAAVSLTFDENTYIILAMGFMTEGYLADKLATLQRSGINMVTYDAKSMYPFIDSEYWRNIDDMMIISYLLNPLKAREYRLEQGFVTYEMSSLYSDIYEQLREQGMEELYNTIEMPLTKVLYDCEREGILVDRDALVWYGESLTDRIAELEDSIYNQAGEKFNINSPKQLGEILFVKLGLEGGKKTKSGYSTAADVLEKLAADNPIIADILEYRGLTKLKSTYADGLLECIEADGRIHTTFNQTITATGRISSTEPNLQNIPVRTEQGRLIRKCFVPKEGYVFVDADYSQIELRLLAHMSQDEGLIEAYNSDADIHRITASKVFGIPFDEVTPEKRRDAKAVNFGLVYGISSFGLSQDLGITRKEAEQYIKDYFITYPGVKNYLDSLVEGAKEKGYVTTLYGRRRPIPELNNSNYMMRQFGERVAMNSPIQGTAADIMKIAMIKVHDALISQGIDAKIIVQVHDELLLEVKAGDAEMATLLLVQEMKNAADLSVRLEVDVHSGKDWYEAK
ncbi:MAG: DNA polymerase I [Lachnospiraceae bacterium]|nr:DNA polymerase I [Candidatus Colinaster scatohippi]